MHVHLELKRLTLRRGADGRCGQGELVDPVDRKIESRAQASENQGDDPGTAQVGGYGEENPVRHGNVAQPSDPPAAPGALSAASDAPTPSTLTAVPETNLSLSTETLDGVRVIRVTGDLDLLTVAAFDAELERAFPVGRLVVVLTDCTFIDSSALRALVRAQQRTVDAGGGFAIVAPSQPARRTLEVASLDRLLPVVETLTEAVTSLA